MKTNLLTVFKPQELAKHGKAVTDIVSLAFNQNKVTGAKWARAVLDDGTTLIKEVTKSGVVTEIKYTLPEITNAVQRNAVIKELAKKKLKQEDIAAMLGISQATVSNVLRKK